MAFDKPIMVIDNGSYYLKAGFACDNHPLAMFRNVIGRPSSLHGNLGRKHYDVLVGDHAFDTAEAYDLCTPVVNGKIEHWDNMERVWHYLFYRDLKVAPEDRSVNLLSTTLASMEEKIKCCEIFFETLNVPALCIQTQSVGAMYGHGLTTGIAVDLGYDTAEICPVYEGSMIKHAHMVTGFAGREVAQLIQQNVTKNGYDLGSRASQVIDDVIKKHCYILRPEASKYKRESYIIKVPHNLANGDTIEIDMDILGLCDQFFNPSRASGDYDTCHMSLAKAVYESSMKCDAELRDLMYTSIVLCGGLSMIPGMQEKLRSDLEELTSKPVQVLWSDEAYCTSWVGGATFAAVPDSQKVMVMQEQYKEYGERIVKNKFL